MERNHPHQHQLSNQYQNHPFSSEFSTLSVSSPSRQREEHTAFTRFPLSRGVLWDRTATSYPFHVSAMDVLPALFFDQSTKLSLLSQLYHAVTSTTTSKPSPSRFSSSLSPDIHNVNQSMEKKTPTIARVNRVVSVVLTKSKKVPLTDRHDKKNVNNISHIRDMGHHILQLSLPSSQQKHSSENHNLSTVPPIESSPRIAACEVTIPFDVVSADVDVDVDDSFSLGFDSESTW